MGQEVTHLELRNASDAILLGLDRGKSFVITREGVPVGELRPIRCQSFTSRESLAELFGGSTKINWPAFRADVRDWHSDHTPEPDPWQQTTRRELG